MQVSSMIKLKMPFVRIDFPGGAVLPAPRTSCGPCDTAITGGYIDLPDARPAEPELGMCADCYESQGRACNTALSSLDHRANLACHRARELTRGRDPQAR